MEFSIDPRTVDEIIAKIAAAENEPTLEVIRVAELGRHGRITTIARMIGSLPPEQRKHHGSIINQIKNRVEEAISERRRQLKDVRLEATLTASRTLTADATLIPGFVDVTLPTRDAPFEIARVHPISQVMDEVTVMFADMGFAVAEGPDVETDDYNFTKLNFPVGHPAREMHDTFFFNQKPDGSRLLLRPHTSPVQVRTMLAEKPPIRVICPGRTYRPDSDQTHTPMFHQLEGLVVDKASHLGHLKWILAELCKAFFAGAGLKIRVRAAVFPFTEPSLELDIQCPP